VHKEVVGQRPSQDTADILRIPVDMIEPNPYQPRMNFDQEALDELADSIRTLGLIQPITVRRKEEGRYQIISGERRFRACRLAGMDMIPAYIRDTNDQGMLEMAIVENIQRENLDPIEVAMSYQRLIEECNLTQEQMAVRVGKKRASVTNYLRLLKLPAKLQHDLKVGLLSVGHAKVLLGIEDLKLQEYLCDLVIKEDLSVRQLEDKIKKLTEQKKAAEPQEEQDLPDEYFKVLEIVGKYFENNISIKRSGSGKGSMTIHFGSDEEVRKFLKALEDSNF
jgi:ParB family chromosome partitioning protein